MHSVVNGIKKKVTLTNVQYVPSRKYNLVSINYLRRKGVALNFDTEGGNIGMRTVWNNKSGSIPLIGIENRTGLYEIVLQPILETRAMVAKNNDIKGLLWHQRLQHFGYSTIRSSLPIVSGIDCEKLDI